MTHSIATSPALLVALVAGCSGGAPAGTAPTTPTSTAPSAAPVAAAHSIVFFEIATPDVARAREFYRELFGWTFAEPATPDAALFETGGTPGMLTGVPDHKGGDSVVVYIGVEHVRATYDRALELGGTAVIPPMAAPGRGTFAVFRDRDANRIGIFSTEAAP